MIHLFSNVYLEHEVFYSSKYPDLIISEIEKPHPVSEKMGTAFGRIPPFQDFLKESHSNNIENFWLSLLRDRGLPKVIYADPFCFELLLLQYLKSIFFQPKSEFVAEIYQTYNKDIDIKLLMNMDRADNFKKFRPGDFKSDTLEELKRKADDSVTIKALCSWDKNDIGFEFLLPGFYNELNVELQPSFLKRLEKLCWKAWLSDVYSLKSDFLASFFTSTNSSNVKEAIENNKLTKWFNDPFFNADHSKHILEQYSPDLFCEMFYQVNSNIQYKNVDNACFSFVGLTEAIFNQSYIKILEDNINNQRGCSLVRGDLTNKANQFLASKIYEEIRTKNHDELKKYRLS
jgi:hypothetical protein